MPACSMAAGLPGEGKRVRSRLWSLILRELPFPFRQIGMEIARTITWFDQSAARILVGYRRSPAWYLVSTAGTAALLLTVLLFFTFISSHDPTLGQLASKSQSVASTSRQSLEAAGDWTAQDKWRVAHMFVDHRPRRRLPIRTLDSRLVPDSFDEPRSPVRSTSVRRMEPEVRLELGIPPRAEQPPRLVYGQLVRDPDADFNPVRRPSRYRMRDSRLLVQAEWAAAADCETEPLRHPLTRRVIPVPEPDWPEPPLLRDDRQPDLAFQMQLLREFLPAVGEFPAKSRPTSVTAYSEFPESLFQSHRSHLLAGHSNHWLRTSTTTEHRPLPEAYITRASDFVEELETPLDDEPNPSFADVPSFAEVALRLELYAPETAAAGRLHSSSLLIHNDGLRPIPLVRVDESLDELETVTDAIPPGRIAGQFVRRETRRLQPATDRRMDLNWWPNEEGERTHRAIVTAQAEVGATTEVIAPAVEQPMPSVAPEPVRPIPVQHPSLAFEAQALEKVFVEDVVEVEILVRNTGDVELHDVRILVALPAQLKHRQGREVEYMVGDLKVRGTHRVLLRMTAQSPGLATCRLIVNAEEPAEANSKVLIDVVPRPVRAVPPPHSALIPRPKTPAVPRPKSLPSPALAPLRDECCCPLLPVAATVEPWLVP